MVNSFQGYVKDMKKIFSLITVFLLLFSFAGCARQEPAAIDIGSLRGPTSIGMIRLHDQQPGFGDMEAEYHIIQSPEIMVSNVLSKDIDIAALPTNIAAQLYNRGIEYSLIAIIGYNVLYIVSLDDSISSWEDLRGKQINVPARGSTPDVVLRYLLAENGLEAGSEVTLDYTANHIEISQLMISGDTDIAILPEPFVTMVLNNNEDTQIIMDIGQEWSRLEDGLPLPMSCLVASRDLLDEHPEIIDEFLKEYEDSVDWVNENPHQASLLVENFEIGMQAETALQAIPRCNIRFTPSAQAKEMVDNFIQVLLDFSPEDVGGKVPDEGFYY